MDNDKKDARLDEFTKITERLSKITSPTKQMQAILYEYGRFIESIWQEGYEQGFHAGKKAWINENKN